MQAYGEGFARVYNKWWSGFAKQAAPLILDFYAATPAGQQNKSVLDLCCGAGHLAVHFLERGYRITGLDLSEPMLQHARENARPYVESGQARFVQGDASNFKLDERFGLIVSTFDSLNHLENEWALKKCFQCAHDSSDGYFIFDLNTRAGLKRWNTIHVDESSEDSVIIARGIYDEQSDRAWTRITGFTGVSNGLYERFNETAFNTAFEMEKVESDLFDTGWRNSYFARLRDLKTPITLGEAEKEERVFIVARK